MRCHLKSFSIVFLTLLVVGLLGFTVVNNNNGTEEVILVVDEFIPVAVKENTVKTSVVELIRPWNNESFLVWFQVSR